MRTVYRFMIAALVAVATGCANTPQPVSEPASLIMSEDRLERVLFGTPWGAVYEDILAIEDLEQRALAYGLLERSLQGAHDTRRVGGLRAAYERELADVEGDAERARRQTQFDFGRQLHALVIERRERARVIACSPLESCASRRDFKTPEPREVIEDAALARRFDLEMQSRRYDYTRWRLDVQALGAALAIYSRGERLTALLDVARSLRVAGRDEGARWVESLAWDDIAREDDLFLRVAHMETYARRLAREGGSRERVILAARALTEVTFPQGYRPREFSSALFVCGVFDDVGAREDARRACGRAYDVRPTTRGFDEREALLFERLFDLGMIAQAWEVARTHPDMATANARIRQIATLPLDTLPDAIALEVREDYLTEEELLALDLAELSRRASGEEELSEELLAAFEVARVQYEEVIDGETVSATLAARLAMAKTRAAFGAGEELDFIMALVDELFGHTDDRAAFVTMLHIADHLLDFGQGASAEKIVREGLARVPSRAGASRLDPTRFWSVSDTNVIMGAVLASEHRARLLAYVMPEIPSGSSKQVYELLARSELAWSADEIQVMEREMERLTRSPDASDEVLERMIALVKSCESPRCLDALEAEAMKGAREARFDELMTRVTRARIAHGEVATAWESTRRISDASKRLRAMLILVDALNQRGLVVRAEWLEVIRAAILDVRAKDRVRVPLILAHARRGECSESLSLLAALARDDFPARLAERAIATCWFGAEHEELVRASALIEDPMQRVWVRLELIEASRHIEASTP